MRSEMIMKKCLLLLCFCLPMVCSYGQEVLFSTLDGVRKPGHVDLNLSTITNNRELIVMDDFQLTEKSQITRFNFVGQLGKSTPENIKLIKGVRLYVLRAFTTRQPLSEANSLNYFELIREYTPGLKITQQGDQVNISIDVQSLGFDLIIEAGTYGIAFAPIIATDGMPGDKVWYWYEGTVIGSRTVVWEGGNWLLTGPSSVAFSIEGKKIKSTLHTQEITPAVVAKVYPNPSNGIFRIKSPKEIASVLIYNSNGQLVLQSATDIIDLSVFPGGVYLGIVMDNDGKQTCEKLIKI